MLLVVTRGLHHPYVEVHVMDKGNLPLRGTDNTLLAAFESVQGFSPQRSGRRVPSPRHG